ncbi:MAG: S1 RNA-binding domain-containing protein, partial [Lachnospiraceae bacterium]|nr:S1 RNA-binding domain-containing protein [Lachnospiraceae bacterium]
YAIGSVVTGKVARMTDFGAFIELEPGIDALLHVSQIAREHINKPSDVLKVGDEVTAKVVDLKPEDKKISLSIKATLAPIEKEKPKEEEAPADDENEDFKSVDIEAEIAKEKEKEAKEAAKKKAEEEAAAAAAEEEAPAEGEEPREE